MIPLVDLNAEHGRLKGEIDAAIAEVLSGGVFVRGEPVGNFERAFAAMSSVDHCIGVANGTDALRLVLEALGVGPGDTVITVPNTFIATAEAITHAGATVAFVDIDADTWLMSDRSLESGVTDDTRAVVPVHLFGHPCDTAAIRRVIGPVHIVEDAAQAHGARVMGRRVGSLGVAAAFSFYPGKNLGALGDGGAVTTDDLDLALRIRMLADHGRTDKHRHEIVGWNSRLDTLQAAVLAVKLAHLDEGNERRRRVARLYREALGPVPELAWPKLTDGSEPVHHLLVVAVPEREQLRAHLDEKGVASGVHYPVPVHLQPAYRHLGYQRGDFPIAERLADTIVSLPIYPDMTEGQVERVCTAILEFYGAS